ncbi:MAG: MlaD family protein [Desulfovibrio sp.]|jgi:paraquat-inducible protein B|nr:MlaD family protein [Desulfovibrio sp.]
MKSQRYKTAVGVFVLGAVALFAIGLVLLTARRFFSDDTEYVLYFDSSVSGLSIGTPVVFRGVPLGSVTRINLVADAREGSVTIPVFISINAGRIVRSDNVAGVSEEFEQQIIRSMVGRGLRARLQLQSLITGKYVVELDFHPDTKPRYRASNTEFEIPTVPSSIDAFQRALSKMPLERLVQSLNEILLNLADALSGGKLKDGIAAFAGTFSETEKLLREADLPGAITNTLTRLDETARAVQEQMPATLHSFREAMRALADSAAQLRRAANSAEDIVRRDSPTVADLRRLLQEGEAAARALRALANMLERNPESLLQGRKGAR